MNKESTDVSGFVVQTQQGPQYRALLEITEHTEILFTLAGMTPFQAFFGRPARDRAHAEADDSSLDMSCGSETEADEVSSYSCTDPWHRNVDWDIALNFSMFRSSDLDL